MYLCFDLVPWYSLVPGQLCRMRIATCTRPKLRIQPCIEHSVLQIGNHAVCHILEKCREHSFTLQQLGPKCRHTVPSSWHDLPFVSFLQKTQLSQCLLSEALLPQISWALLMFPQLPVLLALSRFVFSLFIYLSSLSDRNRDCLVLNSSFISCAGHKD